MGVICIPWLGNLRIDGVLKNVVSPRVFVYFSWRLELAAYNAGTHGGGVLTYVRLLTLN